MLARRGVLWARWYIARLLPDDQCDDEALAARLLALGQWLHGMDYVGHDVRVEYPPREISTVPAFGMMGWINLHRLTGCEAYLEKARYCLSRLFATQTPQGSWPFPYPFRNNPPGFVYSCESFMTLRALLCYHEHLAPEAEIIQRVERAIRYLLSHIGHEDGVFWYSAADHIRVPNISSMAANVLARAALLTSNGEWSKLARSLAGYCLEQQREDGAYPYVEGHPRVYLPYHALETWELAEANEVLQEEAIAASTDRAMVFLTRVLQVGYRSYDDDHDGRRQYLFKTPLWSAKAYLIHGDCATARRHLMPAMRLYRYPGQSYCFYRLNRRRLGPLLIEYPSFRSNFARYNASCFEIGTRLLLAAKGKVC